MCQELSGRVAEGVRMCQEFQEVVRTYQVCKHLSGVSRGCQEFPGCARSCQKCQSCQDLESVGKNAIISKSLFSFAQMLLWSWSGLSKLS